MKLILVFAAVFGFALADDAADLIAAKLFLKCIDKALNEGLPSIPIPSHNPLVIRNITYNDTNILFGYKIAITNNVLYSLMDYNFTQLNATSYSNPEKVNYDYDLYWPLLNITGEYDIALDSLIFSGEVKGTYNILLHHVDWTGIFNLTKPGQESQGIPEHLDEFSLASAVKQVNVTLTGDIDDELIEEALELAVSTVFNNFPAEAADILKDTRFNDFWIDHPERINAIIQNCVA